MTTPLARQIMTRAKAKNISLSGLGKEAGLKDHTIRNILAGQSRMPNAAVLQAISKILDCSIEDLLVDQEFFQEEDSVPSKDELRNRTFDNPNLLIEIVDLVTSKISEKHKKPTIHQVLASIEEIYLHSVQRDSREVDQTFVDWFIGLMEK
jgi:transcriptional regulator with XRE-family HTH domain